MCATTITEKENSSKKKPAQKLMVSAFVCLNNGCPLSTEVRRGMAVQSEEGQEIGKVGAVMLDAESRKATHVLLSRLPEMRGYWLVPVGAITQVVDEYVRLIISKDYMDNLPRWHSDEG